LLRSVGAAAVLLALVGLYAVLTHAVAQRRRELGVRAALGATPRHLGRLVFTRALLHLVVGLALGLLGVIAFDRAFSDATATYRVTDAVVLAVTAAAIGLLTCATCVIPVWRAARTDPMLNLRDS
jgi:putative ABC transport system permease protein